MYYVGFSSCTIVSSLILFQGFNTTDAANTFSLLSGFIVTFLGVHLLNISRIPESPLDHPNGHSTLEGGLMNPRLSLQGRASLDGWTGGPQTGGSSSRGTRHGRQSSLYRSQTTNLFNTFEGSDGDVTLGPISPHRPSRLPSHRKPPSVDLHGVREADEWDHNNDYDEDDNERTALRGSNPRKDGQVKQSTPSSSPMHTVVPSPSRSGTINGTIGSSHAPLARDLSLTDVRITPR